MAYERDRQRGHPHRQRRWWPLVAAFWMAIGLTPCALAAVGNIECGHCPEAVAGSDANGHAGHADRHAGHDGHAAAAVDGHGGCADGDCLDGGDTLVDHRGAGKVGKSTPDTVFLPAVDTPLLAAVAADRYRGADPPAAAPPPFRRLHLIHCVFLD